MTPETPHRVSIYRSSRVDGKYAEPAAVSTENPCLIAPANSGVRQTFMGGFEMVESLLFIGFDVDVQLNDEVYDEQIGDWWVVVERPLKFQNPTDWESGGDHQQVRIERRPIG